MKESITVTRTITLQKKLLPQSDLWDMSQQQKMGIHLHTPDMATEKDSPSAGAAITIAILSALRQIPIDHQTGVTGEIDIHGNILPVGGIYEKLSGAKKAGIKTIFLPKKINETLKRPSKKTPHSSRK